MMVHLMEDNHRCSPVIRGSGAPIGSSTDMFFFAGVLHAEDGTVTSESGATLPVVGLQGWERLLRLTWMNPQTIR